MRLMRMRAMVALLLTVGVAGCSAEGRPVGGGPVSVPEQPRIGVGETVDFSMYTHCGVESTPINGRVWNAVDPLYASPDRLGPPDGWGDPYQDGKLTLESPERAVFVALGERVVLVPSRTGEPLRECD